MEQVKINLNTGLGGVETLNVANTTPFGCEKGMQVWPTNYTYGIVGDVPPNFVEERILAER